MDKILEALKTLLPADQLNEVSAAVKDMLAASKADLDKEYDAKLEEAYKELSVELETAEKTAEQGYAEAFAHITDLTGRLEKQAEEFAKVQEEGFAEAYQMLQEEKAKNNTLELEIYEEYDKKLQEMKEYMVEKVDQFLAHKGSEIYEQAKRDLINDPRTAEWKVTLDKIVEAAAGYIGNDTTTSSAKVDDLSKTVEELKAQVKMMEARNIRLSHDNNKLTEAVRKSQEVLTEAKVNEKKERTTKAKNVSGKGTAVVAEDTKVIAETSAPAKAEKNDDTLLERIGLTRNTAGLLAGTVKLS